MQPSESELAVDFFNHRKQKYVMQATIICNDQRRTLQFSSMDLASVHDMRAFRKIRNQTISFPEHSTF